MYTDNNISDFKYHPFQKKVVTAHKTLKAQFEEALKELDRAVLEAVWNAQVRTVKGAPDVVGIYRNEYGDSHGSGPGQLALVPGALNSALFLSDILTAV